MKMAVFNNPHLESRLCQCLCSVKQFMLVPGRTCSLQLLLHAHLILNADQRPVHRHLYPKVLLKQRASLETAKEAQPVTSLQPAEVLRADHVGDVHQHSRVIQFVDEKSVPHSPSTA